MTGKILSTSFDQRTNLVLKHSALLFLIPKSPNMNNNFLILYVAPSAPWKVYLVRDRTKDSGCKNDAVSLTIL